MGWKMSFSMHFAPPLYNGIIKLSSNTSLHFCHFPKLKRGIGVLTLILYTQVIMVIISCFCTFPNTICPWLQLTLLNYFLEMLILYSSVVWVTLCREKTNLLSEAEFIMKMQEITDKGQLQFCQNLLPSNLHFICFYCIWFRYNYYS